MKFRTILEEQIGDSLHWLKKMVEINSFTRNISGVNRVGDICREMFTPLGFEVEVIPPEGPEFGNHLVLTRRGKSPANILLVSHLDTVYPEEEELENDFYWQEEGDRIYGPGVADIKGGTVMIYLVLKALQVGDPALFEEITWHVILNSMEEEGSRKFPLFARPYATPHSLACLVYECSRMADEETIEIVSARKGASRFLVEAFGKQAHSGSAHPKGANAVWQLCRTLDQLSGLTDYDRDITVNVGVIQGGLAINRVPDYAFAHVDMRTLSKKTCQETREKFFQFHGQGTVKSALDSFPCSIKITELAGYPPWPNNARGHQLAKIVVQSAEELDLNLRVIRKNGASDGCHFWDLVPTLDGLGPVGDHVHCSIRSPEEGKEQEYILPSSFVTKGLLNLALVQKIAERERVGK